MVRDSNVTALTTNDHAKTARDVVVPALHDVAHKTSLVGVAKLVGHERVLVAVAAESLASVSPEPVATVLRQADFVSSDPLVAAIRAALGLNPSDVTNTAEVVLPPLPTVVVQSRPGAVRVEGASAIAVADPVVTPT